MFIDRSAGRLTANCFRAEGRARKAAGLSPDHRCVVRLNSQRHFGFIGIGRGYMPLALAEYLRHLAMRCSRMSRDCPDSMTSKELETISVELIEKAEALEAELAIPHADDPGAVEIITREEDDEK
jgi:hypothetical protein